MDGSSSSSGNDAVDSFFLRSGLCPVPARARCQSFARARYGGSIRESEPQGYCSYTLIAGDGDAVVQFRPGAHRIDIPLALLARDVYGTVAPDTRFLGVVVVDAPAVTTAAAAADVDGDASDYSIADSGGRLFAYSMCRIPGISLAELRTDPPTPVGGVSIRAMRERLVGDFARFLCAGWTAFSAGGGSAGRPRDDVVGRVGGSLRWRLEMMREGLPPRFRPAVADVLAHLGEIEALPWVLTHGDVVPGNIMVEPPPPPPPPPSSSEEEEGGPRATGRRLPPGSLRGLLDWAEAEFLPFGVGVSGAEELLGETSGSAGSAGPYPPPGSRFEYYAEAGDLRRLLWRELQAGIPELADGAVREAVERARVLGVLLWHGIAFDDGRLDRVVREGRDDEEIQRLDVFLRDAGGPGMVVFDDSQGSGEQEPLELARSSANVSSLCTEDRGEKHLAFPRDIQPCIPVLGTL